MAKSYKSKGDDYIDSSGIVHNKTLLKTILNNILNDTGWVDMSSYLNTTYFTARTNYKPEARRIGNVVYWRGEAYCSAAPNNKGVDIMVNIPQEFRPSYQVSRCGVHYQNQTEPYNMFMWSGTIRVTQSTNIPITSDSGGFQFGNLSGYLV